MSDKIENENNRFYYRIDGSAFTISDLLIKSITISSSIDYIRVAIERCCKSVEELKRISKEMWDVASKMRNLSHELEAMFRDNNTLYLSKKINR